MSILQSDLERSNAKLLKHYGPIGPAAIAGAVAAAKKRKPKKPSARGQPVGLSSRNGEPKNLSLKPPRLARKQAPR